MKQDTKLVHIGRGRAEFEGTVNLPVHRASTILSPDVESYIHRFDGDNRFTNITYGAQGTHNARALREAIAALEEADGCIVTSSGLSCITMTLSALLGGGRSCVDYRLRLRPHPEFLPERPDSIRYRGHLL